MNSALATPSYGKLQKPTLALYPGSFDPLTRGHIDIAQRACTMFDRVIFAVAENVQKMQHYTFTAQQRAQLARQALAHLPAVEVAVVSGLVSDYCRAVQATAIIKGLRTGSDLDQEAPMAIANKQLGGVETVFLISSPAYAHLSSTLVKDAARHGADVSPWVTPAVAAALSRVFA